MNNNLKIIVHVQKLKDLINKANIDLRQAELSFKELLAIVEEKQAKQLTKKEER